MSTRATRSPIRLGSIGEGGLRQNRCGRRSAITRCRVIDLDPSTGERRSEALRALAGYRRRGGELVFGVDAVVTRAGRVRVGDELPVPR